MEMITREICEAIVDKYFPGGFLNFELEPIPGEKKGALGEYYNLKLQTTEGSLKLFVKTVLKNPNRPQFTDFVTSKENQFYAHVEKLKEHVPELDVSFMPRCYLQTDKFLILEDIQGVNRSGTLEPEEVELVLESLAKLHASFIIWERTHGASLSGEDFMKEALFATDANFVGSNYVSGVVNGIRKLLLIENFDTSAIANFINLSNEALSVFNGKSKFPNVCCHGDLWSNNVMFLQNGGCKLIDFQMIRYAPAAHDLNMLIYLNCSTETIKNHLESFTEKYYNNLELELKKYNISISKVINKQEYYASCIYFCNISKFVRLYYKAFKAATKKRAFSNIKKPLDVIMQENESNFIVDVMEFDAEFKIEVLEILRDLRIVLKFPQFPPELCLMVMNRFSKDYELLDYTLESNAKKAVASQEGASEFSIFGSSFKVQTSALDNLADHEYVLNVLTLSNGERQEHSFVVKTRNTFFNEAIHF